MSEWPQERIVSIPPQFRPAPVDYEIRPPQPKQRVSAWRAALFAAVIFGAAGFLAGRASADTISISGTMVSLEPTDEPGAVAVVTMSNIQMNGSHDNGLYPIAGAGIVAEVRFTWEWDALTGADRIEVIAPGYVCRPASCTATVPEGQEGRVFILEWIGG